MGAGVLATALALIGVAWFLRPEGNSSDFGVPLSGGRQLAFAYIKGMEYVIAAVLIATFVWRRDRVGTMLALSATLIVPTGDAISVYRAGVSATDIPPVHALLAAIILACVILLGLGRSDDDLETEKARERIALPRSVGQTVVLVMASLLIAAIAVGFTTR